MSLLHYVNCSEHVSYNGISQRIGLKQPAQKNLDKTYDLHLNVRLTSIHFPKRTEYDTEQTGRALYKARTKNCWVFGLFPSSGILENIKHDVSETGSVSVRR
jgi:hypothetical protein